MVSEMLFEKAKIGRSVEVEKRLELCDRERMLFKSLRQCLPRFPRAPGERGEQAGWTLPKRQEIEPAIGGWTYDRIVGSDQL